jgi:hypothetical protein
MLAQSKTSSEPLTLNAKHPSEAFTGRSATTTSPEPHSQVPLSLSNFPDVQTLLHFATIYFTVKNKITKINLGEQKTDVGFC